MMRQTYEKKCNPRQLVNKKYDFRIVKPLNTMAEKAKWLFQKLDY